VRVLISSVVGSRHHRPRRIALAAAGFLLVSCARALAQASLQVPLEFDFLNPGARSLALGSAFTGLADDSTAAFTNPAGLLMLRDPEISFEGRSRRHESRYLQSGRTSGPVTGRGIDTIPSAVYGTSVSEDFGPSYFSFVYPHRKTGGRHPWVLAAYRHEFVRLQESFEAQGVFLRVGQRELALRASRSLSLTTYGVSGAYEVNQRLRLGGGVTVVRFQLDAVFDRYFSGFFDAPTFAPETHIGRATESADDTGVGLNVGGLYTLIDDPQRRGPKLVQLGLVYRKGAAADFTSVFESIPFPSDAVTGTFKTPDELSAGVAIRFSGAAMLTADAAYVRYTNLKEDYIAQATVMSPAATRDRFDIDNVVEAHLGFEYAFPVRFSPSLRVGTWYDPAHAVRYTAPAQPSLTDERFAAYAPGADDQTHFTFGGGAALTDFLEVNVGADLSGRKRVVSVSAVVRFLKRQPKP
jgi:long-chain fatty acid transport protein